MWCNVRTYEWVYVCMYVCMYVSTYVCMSVCLSFCLYVLSGSDGIRRGLVPLACGTLLKYTVCSTPPTPPGPAPRSALYQTLRFPQVLSLYLCKMCTGLEGSTQPKSASTAAEHAQCARNSGCSRILKMHIRASGSPESSENVSRNEQKPFKSASGQYIYDATCI